MSSKKEIIPKDLIAIADIVKPKGLKGELKVFLYNSESKTFTKGLKVWFNQTIVGFDRAKFSTYMWHQIKSEADDAMAGQPANNLANLWIFNMLRILQKSINLLKFCMKIMHFHHIFAKKGRKMYLKNKKSSIYQSSINLLDFGMTTMHFYYIFAKNIRKCVLKNKFNLHRAYVKYLKIVCNSIK